jgi:hypothetical protein
MQIFLTLALAIDPELDSTIKCMDSANFQARELATKNAAGYGIRALPLLARSAANHPSAEVRDRCRVAIAMIEKELDSYWRIYPTNYPLKRFPLIGSLATTTYPRGASLAGHYLHQSIKSFQTGDNVETERSRQATALFVRDLLHSGKSREEVQVTVNLMADHERAWWLRNSPERMPSEFREKVFAPRVPQK